MGSLSYDNVIVDFDDRALIHLQIVIVQKLRRGESFLMSWRDSIDVGSGRTSIWLHPSIPLQFKFHGGRIPVINREWLAVLQASAEGSHGLIVSSEPAGPAGGPVLGASAHVARRADTNRHTTADLTPGR